MKSDFPVDVSWTGSIGRSKVFTIVIALLHMQAEVVFLTIDFRTNKNVIRRYTHPVEDLGYDHILVHDHVLCVGPDRFSTDSYDIDDSFYDPFSLFSFMAGITETVGFWTGVLILPQRQTALVAKQAAMVDVLSGGRFRLGVGLGWNLLEYEALGIDWETRAARLEEQIEVLRELCGSELGEYDGEFHSIQNIGITPRPTDGSIPIWIGGEAPPALRRVVTVGEGWHAIDGEYEHGTSMLSPNLYENLEQLYDEARNHGVNPDDICIQGSMLAPPNSLDEWIRRAAEWKEFGADYLSISTLHQQLDDPERHIDMLSEVAETISDAGICENM